MAIPRGLPCSCAPEKNLWAIVGQYSDGTAGGVLDWCFDREDAMRLLDEYLCDDRFKRCSAIPYIPIKQE